MDRSEPALVPEWLKGSNGGINGGGSSLHHIASALQSDDHSTSNSTRSKLFVSSNDNEASRTSDRKSSHFRRSSSSNGSILHDKGSLHSRSYSSFSRSHRERDWERDLEKREKDRVPLRGHRDFSDSLMLSTDVLMSQAEKDVLRRSLSTMSGNRGEVKSKRLVNDLNSRSHVAGSTMASHSNKSTFERDFPSLGSEEKTGVPEVGRVKSPGLSSPSQSLPMNSSTVIGGDGWTSKLAEVPVIIGGSSSVILPSPVAPSSSVNMPPSSNTGLNMAEALVQAPARARTPQLSVDTQRLEELAIKQSRQLIPVTPSMPKNGALSSLDKSKSKALRTTELSGASKAGQQTSSSQLVNNSLRGPSKSDSLKTSQSNSNFVVLNRERNGFPNSVGNETPSPTHASKLLLGVIPSAATVAPLKSPANAKFKTTTATCSQISAPDKKLTSQAQNRNDFFNSLRKKTSANNNHLSAIPDSAVSPAPLEKSEEQLVENPSVCADNGKDVGPSSGSALDCSLSDSGTAVASSGGEIFCSDEHDVIDSDAIAYPDEEEEAFLKSLGWDADAQEAALTEEEIQSFIEEYNKVRPTSKVCRHLNGVSFTTHMENLTCSSASEADA